MGVEQLALGAGLAWASGIRLYVVLFFAGALHYMDWVALPQYLRVLAHPAVLTASGLMVVLEFIADKFPGFDSIWDAIHSFIRIPAGALLAVGALAGMDQMSTPWLVAAGILGGAITAGSHFTKAGSRVLINHSPEPVSNWIASASEDIVAPGIVWTALFHPVALLVLLALFLLIALWLLPKLWRAIREVLRTLRGWFAAT